MPKKSDPPEFTWQIYRLRKSPAEFVGRVYAKDQAGAIARAIEEYKITDPEKRKRLVAQKAR